MVTRPKLMLPFQIARAIHTYFAWRPRNACSTNCHVERSREISGSESKGVTTKTYPEIPRLRCTPLEMTNENSCNDPSLRGKFELLARNAAQLEKANQRLLNQIVGARRAGSDPNDGRSVRQPEMRDHFTFLVQVVVLDLRRGNEP